MSDRQTDRQRETGVKWRGTVDFEKNEAGVSRKDRERVGTTRRETNGLVRDMGVEGRDPERIISVETDFPGEVEMVTDSFYRVESH